GTLYDAYGAVDTDGLGTAWDYTDKRAVRVPGTVDPNAVWTASEWTILAANVADFDPGVYTSIAPPDATLSDLTIDAVTVGSFNAAITSYTVVLPAGTTTVPTVAYTLNDAGATASQVDATDLAGDASARTTTITVTAEDGLTTLDYTILFNPILEVATIADLRAVTDLDRTYTVTGEVVLTHQDGFRNKKYLEDATGAIEVDDVLTGNFDPGVITTVYNVGDGITGLTGVLEDYYGYLQFHPSVNPGEATSNINAVEPQVITVSEFTSNFDTYASEFVKIVGVSFADGGSTFGNGKNYAVTVGEDATVVRTHFYNTVTGAIPNMADVQGVAVWDFGAAKIALRMQSDLMPYSSDASLSDLQVNAATVSGFVAGTMSYDVLLDVGTTTVPPVTYTITDAGATAVLTDATDLFGDLAARTTTVVVTAADGTEATYTIVFTVDNTGLDNSMSTKLTLYPVPASNVLNIKGMNGINSIEIINVVGNVVKRMNVESEMMSIDISNLSSGVYFIRANESTYRFIKK
ncbi:MAG: T9SS type A sorting domain-containing protein, partial [Bacteroidetes bacterium]|nr:T9SS type A sorting domain-containing protein [Bacteroidota bacterium]